MSERITPPTTYYAVFAGLIGLTILTVALSMVHLGEWHTAVGIAIAIGKALLVVLFFMHLLHSNWLTWIAAGTGIYWLGILIVLTMSDYLTRWFWIY
jgi:cytochrome c oxidase subunit 4